MMLTIISLRHLNPINVKSKALSSVGVSVSCSEVTQMLVSDSLLLPQNVLGGPDKLFWNWRGCWETCSTVSSDRSETV
jgi:hypothetical protein